MYLKIDWVFSVWPYRINLNTEQGRYRKHILTPCNKEHGDREMTQAANSYHRGDKQKETDCEPRSEFAEGNQAFNEGLCWAILGHCVSWNITSMRLLTTESG